MSRAPAKTGTRKVIAAAIIGNALEFYDFTIYAFFATMIGKAFFPSDNPTVSLLLTVAVFGVGFFTRPLGSIVIGSIADRKGRRSAMILTIACMALGTLILVLTPSYASIGIAAPILIVCARLLQGFALGGEVGPVTAFLYEIAPENRKASYTAWQGASQGLATVVAGMIGIALVVTLSPEAMGAWGWRVPLALGLVIVVFGMWMRRNMPETLETTEQGARESMLAPVLALLRHHHVVLLAVLAQIAFGTIANYIGVYMTTYAVTELKLPQIVAMMATVFVGICVFAGALAGGMLADRLGPMRVAIAARLALIVLIYPVFTYTYAHPGLGTLALTILTLSGLSMVSTFSVFATMAEVIPPQYRGTGLSLSYSLIVAIFGGTAQLVVASFIALTGDPAVPAYYLMLAGTVSLIALGWLRPRSAPLVATGA